ncbi:DUF4236 domain-containing protein [Pedobacter sp. UYP1]|uniref:DUF4236 domain-containing protein n=1 Tax=Pedobacter sp. UYP1 TaxID=1756396 RepID=UPI0033961C02
MGLILRRSVKIGPVRVNFSNKGISYSAGIKGARINTGPRGTYVTIGTNGIYYKQRIGEYVNQTHQPTLVQTPGMHTITSAHIDQLTDVDSKAFIDELSEKAGKVSLVTWLGIWPMIAFVTLLSINSFTSRETLLQAGGLRKVATIDSHVGSNIRSLPNGDSKVLRTTKYAEEFTLLDETNKKWLKIQFHDSVGYVAKKLARIGVKEDPREVSSEFYSTNPYYLLILGSGLLFFAGLIFFLSKRDKKRFEMELHYEMDDQMAILYKAFALHFSSFNSSSRKWQYLHTRNNEDWKRNAGAGKLINRIPIASVLAHKTPIRYFKTNVAMPYIKLKNTELFFLPERLLIRRGNQFAAVFYKNLVIENISTRFIEDQVVAADALIVDHTWKYVNKNGGPDRRFNNNRKIPICLYSEYTLSSRTGVYETICTSRIGAFDGFSNYLNKIGQLQSVMHSGVQIN